MKLNERHCNTKSLTREWAVLTGVGLTSQHERDLQAEFRQNNESPLLLWDSLAFVCNIFLLLPSGISLEFFDTVVQAAYNFHLVQVLLRLSMGLSKNEKESLKAQYAADAAEKADSSEIMDDINIGAVMGRIITNMEPVKLYVSLVH